MRAASIIGGQQGANLVVMGASIDWGGHYDAADHDVRDWPTIIVGQCADAPGSMLFGPCTRLNLAISGVTTFQVAGIPYRPDQSRTIVVFGAIWANNILGGGQSAETCYAYLVSQVAAVLALGITRIVIATPYLVAAESELQQIQSTALSAMIVDGKGGHPGATVARLDLNPPIDPSNAVDFPDHQHPSCPGSAVDPGPGMIVLARQFAPAINAQL